MRITPFFVESVLNLLDSCIWYLHIYMYISCWIYVCEISEPYRSDRKERVIHSLPYHDYRPTEIAQKGVDMASQAHSGAIVRPMA
jgi:hypothetical protein